MNAPQPVHTDPKPNWFVRHKILTVFLAVIAVAIVVGAINSASGGPSNKPDGSSNSVNADPGSQDVPTPDTAPRIGTPVRDGKFEFVVSGVQAGVSSVGEDFLTETAQGEYILVTLTVRNIGDRAQAFATSAQKLLDGQGRQYSVDDMATIVLDQNVAYAQINPGNSIEATVAFDVPAGTVAAEIELHDSLFSGGSTVALQG